MNGDGTDGSWWRMVEGQARSGRGDPPACGFPIEEPTLEERATGASAIKARVRSTSIRFASTTAASDAAAAPDAVSAAWKAIEKNPEVAVLSARLRVAARVQDARL